MEYPILFVVIIAVFIVALVKVICVLSKALSNKKNGAFRIEIKLGKLAFVLDFSSSKT